MPAHPLSVSTLLGCITLLSCPLGAAENAPKAPADYIWTEEATKLQVLLDNADFGPGKIDGQPGEFTDKALAACKKAGQDPEKMTLPAGTELFIMHRVATSDIEQVGPLAATPEEQAAQKSMPYPSVLEAVSERYHADPDFLRALNKDKNLDELKAGDEVKVPNVQPFELEKVQVKGTLPKDKKLVKRRLEVDTTAKSLSVYDGEKLVALFPITPGSEKLPAPKGTWKIESVTTLPVFRWDEKMLKEGERSEDFHLIQPGPRNPVGVLWIQLLDKPGIGIHGTDHPETIGRAASHGCIRLANWDAIKLSRMITSGASVNIR